MWSSRFLDSPLPPLWAYPAMRFAYTKKRKKNLESARKPSAQAKAKARATALVAHAMRNSLIFFFFLIFQYLFEANKSYNIMKTPTRFRAIKILLKSPRKLGECCLWGKNWSIFQFIYIYSTLCAINKYYIMLYSPWVLRMLGDWNTSRRVLFIFPF